MLHIKSCLALTLGVTKFNTTRDIILSHFVVLLKSDLDVQQTHLCCIKGSCIALAFGVTKFTTTRDIIWSHFVVLLKSDLHVQQTCLL
jgi:hypothetical protein